MDRGHRVVAERGTLGHQPRPAALGGVTAAGGVSSAIAARTVPRLWRVNSAMRSRSRSGVSAVIRNVGRRSAGVPSTFGVTGPVGRVVTPDPVGVAGQAQGAYPVGGVRRRDGLNRGAPDGGGVASTVADLSDMAVSSAGKIGSVGQKRPRGGFRRGHRTQTIPTAGTDRPRPAGLPSAPGSPSDVPASDQQRPKGTARIIPERRSCWSERGRRPPGGGSGSPPRSTTPRAAGVVVVVPARVPWRWRSAGTARCIDVDLDDGALLPLAGLVAVA